MKKLVKESLSPMYEYASADTNILKGKKEVPIRVYKWSDPNMGWGDAGTKMYAVVPVEAFEVEEHKRDDGSKWYVFNLKDEWRKKVQLDTGFSGSWNFDFGDKKRKQEIKEAEQLLKIAKEVKKF